MGLGRRFSGDHLPSASFLRDLGLCGLVTAVFLRLFILTSPQAGFPEVSRADRYLFFNVMPAAFPGHDSRNIQTAAYCADQGFPLFGANPCMEAAAPVRAVYPAAHVPVLNYPSLWPRLYGLFHDYS